MRRVHPLWRGFWLACVLAAVRVLLNGVDERALFRGDRAALALAGAAVFGALLAAAPGWLRRRGRLWLRPGWKRCLTAFLSGVAMALALGMADSGRVLFALYEGSTGAYAFVGAAAVTAFVTARIVERRGRT